MRSARRDHDGRQRKKEGFIGRRGQVSEPVDAAMDQERHGQDGTPGRPKRRDGFLEARVLLGGRGTGYLVTTDAQRSSVPWPTTGDAARLRHKARMGLHVVGTAQHSAERHRASGDGRDSRNLQRNGARGMDDLGRGEIWGLGGRGGGWRGLLVS